MALAFLPHSPRLLAFASPCLGAAALLYDAVAGAPLRVLAVPAPVASLAVSPCGGLLALGLTDCSILMADTEGAASLALKGHSAPVAALAFADGGAALASAAGDVMWLWPRDALRSAP